MTKYNMICRYDSKKFLKQRAPPRNFWGEKAGGVFNYLKDMSFPATAKFILTNATGDCSQIWLG